MMHRHTRFTRAAALPAVVLIAVVGCSTGSAKEPSSSEPAPGSAFPVTIKNCGTDVTIEARPERIVLVNNDPVGNIEALGAIDRVVALTAPLQQGLYESSTYSALGALEVLTTETNATGGSPVSQEAILGAEPDLVIAPESGVDRDALTNAGIPVFSPSAYCADPGPEITERATFDRVWDELRDYATVLGESELGETVIEEAMAALPKATDGERTAVALYVTPSVVYPYGAPSMVTPVFEAAGLKNVYEDVDERVFEASAEDLLSRNPDVIVLLYSADTAEDVLKTFTTLPGMDRLTAVRDKYVVALPFPYTDPPSILSTRGPEVLKGLLADLP